MPTYVNVARRLEGGEQKMALIQMPPVGHNPALVAPLPGSIVTGRLAETHEWFAETPVEMQLETA